MKLSNIIIIIVLVILCAAGWLGLVTQAASSANRGDEYVEQAEEYMDQGLYQRASDCYLAAMDGEADEELMELAVDAYAKRYQEAPQECVSQYADLLEQALGSFPANTHFLEEITPIYQSNEEYRKLYSVLSAALKNGCEEEDVLELYRQVKYLYDLRSTDYSDIRDQGGSWYLVHREEKGWNLYSYENGLLLETDRDLVGPCGEDLILALVSDAPMLFSTEDAKVLGLLPKDMKAAGLYSEGLTAVETAKGWGYYDEFGALMFDGFDAAGAFTDGLAAVESDGEWMLIDTEGDSDSDGFDRILLDRDGRWGTDGTALVLEDGSLTLYKPDKWKDQWSVDAEDADIRTPDGITAFCDNGKWGFVDSEGEIVLEPAYAGARSFSNGLAAIMDKSGLWGYIDREGNIVIDCQFEQAGYLDAAGMAPVYTEVTDTQSSEQEEPVMAWFFLKLKLGVTED